MLLTRENNLLKSRACEECAKTGIRAKGYGEIEFYWQGGRKYEGTCVGCFWHDPSKWRRELNKKVKG